MRTVWPRLLAGLVAVVLLLGGCGEDSPKPKPLPKPSKSRAPPRRLPAPPAMPCCGEEPIEGRARLPSLATTSTLINFAQSTGDLQALRAVEDKACKSCAQAESYLAELYGSGGSIRGWRTSKSLSASALKNPSNRWLVSLGVRFGPQVVDHPTPKADEHPKGGRLPAQHSGGVRLEWMEGPRVDARPPRNVLVASLLCSAAVLWPVAAHAETCDHSAESVGSAFAASRTLHRRSLKSLRLPMSADTVQAPPLRSDTSGATPAARASTGTRTAAP